MARKGASAIADAGEPRRSSRIKDQAKPGPPSKKAPTKPRSRKPKTAEAEGGAVEKEKEKPKSAARGKKRTAAEKDVENTPPPVNGEDAQPPAKKAKPDSQAASKPASKPASKAVVTGATKKPVSKIAASGAGVKPASKTAAKPASRAGSRKPASKAEVEKKDDSVAPAEATIAEEPEAEAAATTVEAA